MTRQRIAALMLIVGGGGAALLTASVGGRSPPLGALPEQVVANPPEAILPAKTNVAPLEATAKPTAKSKEPGIALVRDGPGARALRAETEVYCEYNRAAVEEQARKEGLTPGEVKELTFLGSAAMRTAQPVKVQQVLGRTLSPEERNRLGEILQEENEGFKKAMRLKVQERASLEERWRFIREYESQYMQLFMQTFGMTPAQFDQLLGSEPDPRMGVPAPLPGEVPRPPAESARPPPPEVPPDHPQRKPEPSQGLTTEH